MRKYEKRNKWQKISTSVFSAAISVISARSWWQRAVTSAMLQRQKEEKEKRMLREGMIFVLNATADPALSAIRYLAVVRLSDVKFAPLSNHKHPIPNGFRNNR